MGKNIAIRLASLNGHSDVIKLLLSDARVDPSDQSNEGQSSVNSLPFLTVIALVYTALWGRVDLTRMLLNDPRVNPTDRNNAGHSTLRINTLSDNTENSYQRCLQTWPC